MSLVAAGTAYAGAVESGAEALGASLGGGAMVHSFAGFRFDPATGLERDGRRIPLAPTESRLLATLLAAGGRIVTKDELARRVWSGAAASDNSISRAVCAIRRTLRRYSEEQVVETIYGSGFRIAVPVELAPAPWRPYAIASYGLKPGAVECLQAARELLKAGRPAEVREAAAEVERALRLLCGEDQRGPEPVG